MTAAYSVEVDRVERPEWEELISLFDDARIYQTWSYGAMRWGIERLSHLVLREGSDIVAISQVTVFRLPVVGIGIAYVPWGPLWRRRGERPNPDRFRAVIVALKEEYVNNRGLLLRIAPNVSDEDASGFRMNLSAEGYKWNGIRYRTLVLDLTPPIDVIRKRFDQKWRNQLNRAEKNDLTVLEGTGLDLYEKFTAIYQEMMGRKNFSSRVDINEFAEIQRDLAESQKMRILISEQQGKPVAAMVGSGIGDTGIYLHGATSNDGTQFKGSYLLQWRMIQWLREQGCRQYDLGGIDPEENPGVYHFKRGISSIESSHIGHFEACPNRFVRQIVSFGESTFNYVIGKNYVERIYKEKWKFPSLS